MAVGSPTPRLGLARPDRGDPDWDTPVNSNMDIIDEAVALTDHDHPSLVSNDVYINEGDIIIASGAGTTITLPAGAPGEVLTIDPVTGEVSWAPPAATDPAAVPKNLVSFKGDLIVATADDTVVRLAVGANDTVLTADSAQPTGLKWGPGVASHSGLTTSVHGITDTALLLTTAAHAATDHDDILGCGDIPVQADAPSAPDLHDLWVDEDEEAQTSGVAAAVDQLTVYSKTGALTTSTGVARFRFPFAAVVQGVSAAINTAPTGASVIVDVNKNGTTIYTTQANRPTIAISGNSAAETTPNVGSFAGGDYITVDVDQIGSTVAGSDLTVFIRWRLA